MAASLTLTPIALTRNTVGSIADAACETLANVDGTDNDTAYIDMDAVKDDKLMLYIKGGGAGTVTVKATDTIFAGPATDLAITTSATTIQLLQIDTVRFKQAGNKIKLTVANGTTGYIAAVVCAN